MMIQEKFQAGLETDKTIPDWIVDGLIKILADLNEGSRSIQTSAGIFEIYSDPSIEPELFIKASKLLYEIYQNEKDER